MKLKKLYLLMGLLSPFAHAEYIGLGDLIPAGMEAQQGYSNLAIPAYAEKWPTDKTIDIVFSDRWNEKDKKAVMAAFYAIADITDLTFAPASLDVVKFTPAETKGKQIISRADNKLYPTIFIDNTRRIGSSAASGLGFFPKSQISVIAYSSVHGTVASQGPIFHEIMHILGFSHEMNRADRDQFIQVDASALYDRDLIGPGMWTGVTADDVIAAKQKENDTLSDEEQKVIRRKLKYWTAPLDVVSAPAEYDLSSLMHYSIWGPEGSGRHNFEIINDDNEIALGQVGMGIDLSDGDRARLHKEYTKQPNSPVPDRVTLNDLSAVKLLNLLPEDQKAQYSFKLLARFANNANAPIHPEVDQPVSIDGLSELNLAEAFGVAADQPVSLIELTLFRKTDGDREIKVGSQLLSPYMLLNQHSQCLRIQPSETALPLSFCDAVEMQQLPSLPISGDAYFSLPALKKGQSVTFRAASVRNEHRIFGLIPASRGYFGDNKKEIENAYKLELIIHGDDFVLKKMTGGFYSPNPSYLIALDCIRRSPIYSYFRVTALKDFPEDVLVINYDSKVMTEHKTPWPWKISFFGILQRMAYNFSPAKFDNMIDELLIKSPYELVVGKSLEAGSEKGRIVSPLPQAVIERLPDTSSTGEQKVKVTVKVKKLNPSVGKAKHTSFSTDAEPAEIILPARLEGQNVIADLHDFPAGQYAFEVAISVDDAIVFRDVKDLNVKSETGTDEG
ncbi:M12 family metallopeptidase, partial [Veronia pacifica]